MAGMFYSLEEVCEKLGKSEDEIKQLVQEGKLREFRDGSNLLFKIEDVDAVGGGMDDETSVALSIDDSGELSQVPEEPEVEATGFDEVGLEDLAGESSGTDIGLSATAGETGGETLDELSLEELTGEMPAIIGDDGGSGLELDELASEDTKFATGGDSINVLGGTEDGYSLTDDTSSETKLAGGESEEESIGRLDDDVNLDSFGGSGSGLLDLSLQADDTSLGAVLDDIYPESADGGDGAISEGMGVVEEAEKIFEDAEPEAAPMAARVAVAYGEPVSTGTDVTSVIALFIALLAMIYAGIIVAAAVVKGITPSLALPVQDIIWYIAAGAAALVVIVVGLGAMMGGTPAKSKKVKKAAEVYQQGQKS